MSKDIVEIQTIPAFGREFPVYTRYAKKTDALASAKAWALELKDNYNVTAVVVRYGNRKVKIAPVVR